ncbi:MAG TPA: hypothetical protein EYN91_12775 [Candidatus Melainabacteria bacterium]|jgi:hypothetical protein|nr:hypothetical protein [Candidatus Melainabacteria bacterium]HIN66753.1 hypothetical protein [Candidatus Obscuribacterales bacterium]
MSEILQALELRAQANGTAQEAEPVVDMRRARLLPAKSDNSDTQHLPPANDVLMNPTYELDTDNDEGLDVKGLLAQLLTFPRQKDGIVADSWGTEKRAEIKRISTDADSVYTLDSRVQSVLDGIRQDVLELRKTRTT